MTPEELAGFWAKVERHGPADCWPWLGYRISRAGRYGSLRIAGRMVYAHRLSYELHHGPIPPGLYVCHTCDCGLCVNPAHLFAGTPKDNSADMCRKGRQHNSRKLSDAQVLRIVELRQRGLPCTWLARQYGVAETTIGRLLRGRSYRNVARPSLAGHPAMALPRKISAAQVDELVARYRAGGVSYARLAADYGIDQSYVSYLVHGKRRTRRPDPALPAYTASARTLEAA